MSNITTTTIDPYIEACELYFWYPYRPHITTGVYFVLTPICFVLGLIGNSICLVAYYKQSKKEQAYLQQIFVSITAICFGLADMYFTTLFKYFYDLKYEWWRRCYVCMWFTTYTSSPAQNVCASAHLFMTFSMAFDRLLSMAKPHFYLNYCKRKHHYICFCVCISLAVVTSLFDPFQTLLIDQGDGSYLFGYSPYQREFRYGLAQLRSAIRVLIAVLLSICNVSLVYRYVQRSRKVGQITINEPAKEKKRREAEITLIILASNESFLTSVSMGMHAMFFVMIYTWPSFKVCELFLAGPMVDMAMIVGDTLNFYVMFILRRQFRAMILKSLPCSRREG